MPVDDIITIIAWTCFLVSISIVGVRFAWALIRSME